MLLYTSTYLHPIGVKGEKRIYKTATYKGVEYMGGVWVEWVESRIRA